MREPRSYLLYQLIKEPIFLLAFLLSSFSVTLQANDAQAKIDSLITRCEMDISNDDRLVCYLDISYYYQPIDTVQMWVYYEKTVALANKTGATHMVSAIHLDIGNWYGYMGDLDKAEEWYLKAVKVSKADGDVGTEMLSWLNIAGLELTRTNYERHVQIVDSCLQVAITQNLPDVEMPCYGLYGMNYWRMGEYDKAMEYSLKSLKMAEDLGWRNKVIQLYNNIGLIYKDREEFDKALFYLKKSLDRDYFIDPEIYHHIGRIYLNQGELEMAAAYFDTTQNLALERSNPNLQSGVLNSMSELEFIHENYDMALTNLLEAKSIINGTDQKEYLGRVYLNLSKVHRLLSAHDSAIYYAKTAVELCLSNDEKETLSMGYLYWSEALQSLGDFEQALVYNAKYSEVKNDILNEKRLKNISVAEIKYETAKKDLEIERSQQNLKNLQVENNEILTKWGVSLILMVLFFGALFAFLKVESTKKEQKLQEEFTKNLIQSQEEERKKISGDLHDSIGQNLLLIKSNNEVVKNEKLNTLVSETLDEVRAISRNLHPVQLERLGFTKAIELVIDNCEKAGDIIFSDDLENIDGLLSKEREINLYRVIQESFNNILKHSMATAAKLKIEVVEQNIILEIQDNGVGFSYSKKIKTGKTIGLTSLNERTKYLKGTWKVKSEKDKGTTFTFVIPHKV
jgi:signal transduction histidine kinase